MSLAILPQTPRSPATAAGFSLIELMISILLGTLLIAGAGATYLSSKRSYTEVEQVSTLTENARFAEQVIVDALLHTGFMGEVTAGKIEPDPALINISGTDCSGRAAAYDFRSYIFAATVDSSNNAVTCIDDGMEDTDVLVLKRAVPSPLSDGPRDGSARNGTIDTPGGLQAGTTYIMTNNILGTLFDGNRSPALDIQDGGDVPNGTAWPYLFEAYYIRDPDPASDEDTPVLARKILSWNGAAMEIITEDVAEGVEDMRVRFGLDTTGDNEVNVYNDVATMGAADWERVEAVEVHLLVRSGTADPEFTDTKTYQMGGDTTVTPATEVEHYRRLLISTQASLRNPKLIVRGRAE